MSLSQAHRDAQKTLNQAQSSMSGALGQNPKMREFNDAPPPHFVHRTVTLEDRIEEAVKNLPPIHAVRPLLQECLHRIKALTNQEQPLLDQRDQQIKINDEAYDRLVRVVGAIHPAPIWEPAPTLVGLIDQLERVLVDHGETLRYAQDMIRIHLGQAPPENLLACLLRLDNLLVARATPNLPDEVTTLKAKLYDLLHTKEP